MNKDRMRIEARDRLARLGEVERWTASRTIETRLWELEPIASARTIMLYASVPGEVATDAIAAEATRRGIATIYPRCLRETRAMVLHRVEKGEELRSGGAYGIREPDPACPVVDTSDVDVALVPGLAWDRFGSRLGRGAGYYDRLFLGPRVERILDEASVPVLVFNAV